MKRRYLLYLRNQTCYCQDTLTGRQQSLRTKDRITAERIVHAKNEAERQPAINLQIARAYLAGSDPEVATRTWVLVMTEMGKLKKGSTLERWLTAVRDSAFDLIRDKPLLETRPEHLLKVMEEGTVSTNVFLRRMHNFAADMSWLPWPILPKKRWPSVQHKSRRAIS